MARAHLRAETPPQTAGDELVSVVTLIISLCHDFANVADGARSKQLDALISSGKATVWLDGQVATCSLMDTDTA
jgi:hypothetical protein